MNIINIHNEIFDYLYELYEKDRVFFLPRKTNSYNRLKEGYIFTGSKDHLQVSFWDSSSKMRRAKTIGYTVEKDGSSYLEFNPRDYESEENLRRAALVEEVVAFLRDDFELAIEEPRPGYYRMDFSSEDYMANLEEMLDYKYLIDEKIKNSKDSSLIPILDREACQKYIDKVLELHR